MKFNGTPLWYLGWATTWWILCVVYSLLFFEHQLVADFAKAFVSGSFGLYNAFGFRSVFKD